MIRACSIEHLTPSGSWNDPGECPETYEVILGCLAWGDKEPPSMTAHKVYASASHRSAFSSDEYTSQVRPRSAATTTPNFSG